MDISIVILIALTIFVFITCLRFCMKVSINQEPRRNQNNNIYQPSLMNQTPISQTLMNQTPINQTPINQTLIRTSNQPDSHPHHININIANNMLIGSQSRTLIRSMDYNDENSPPPSYDTVMGIMK